jgi:hypothetical protein
LGFGYLLLVIRYSVEGMNKGKMVDGVLLINLVIYLVIGLDLKEKTPPGIISGGVFM